MRGIAPRPGKVEERPEAVVHHEQLRRCPGLRASRRNAETIEETLVLRQVNPHPYRQ